MHALKLSLMPSNCLTRHLCVCMYVQYVCTLQSRLEALTRVSSRLERSTVGETSKRRDSIGKKTYNSTPTHTHTHTLTHTPHTHTHTHTHSDTHAHTHTHTHTHRHTHTPFSEGFNFVHIIQTESVLTALPGESRTPIQSWSGFAAREPTGPSGGK